MREIKELMVFLTFQPCRTGIFLLQTNSTTGWSIYPQRRQFPGEKEKAEQIEIKNNADSVCYQTKKQLEELDSKIDANEKESVQSLITKLETAIQNEDTNSMKSLTEEVKQVMMEIGQKVYSQTDTPDQNPSATDSIETDFSVGK